MNASCNWVDLLRVSSVQFSSVRLLRTNLNVVNDVNVRLRTSILRGDLAREEGQRGAERGRYDGVTARRAGSPTFVRDATGSSA